MTDIRPGSYVGTVRIDSGDPYSARLVIEQDIRIEHTNLPRPDPGWEFVDAAGHFHAYDTANELPTLDARHEHRNCDGSCGGQCQGEGYGVTTYTCHLCGEVVKPGWIPGPHSFPVHGRMSWHIDVESIGEQGRALFRFNHEQVSARFTGDAGEWFGIAHAYPPRSWSSDDPVTRTVLQGAGPLGQRAKRRTASNSSA